MLLKLKMEILKTFGFQYKAARAIGIRDDELSAILHGRKKFAAGQLKILANLLNITERDLLEIINLEENTEVDNEK